MFDFDGTLVDSNTIKYQKFFEVTKHLSGAADILRTILDDPDSGDRSAIFDYLVKRLRDNHSGPKVDVTELVGKYTSRCEEEIVCAPEIQGASYALRAIYGYGINMVVSSATPKNTLRTIVEKRGLGPFFLYVLGTPDSKEQHIDYIKRSLRCHEREILYVGDSEGDRRVALQNGCRFIGLGINSSRFNAEPDILIHSLEELPKEIIFMQQHEKVLGNV